MRKHGIACAFALIGFGVSLSFAQTDKGLNWLTVMMFVCGGMFVGYFVAGLISAKSSLLQKNFVALGDLRGRSLDEIRASVGEPKSFDAVRLTDRNNETGYRYTWAENSYCIVLLFDSNKNCIGVQSETKL